MNKLRLLFFKDEGGAVTVDWVVLTSVVVGLGLIVGIPVVTVTEIAAEDIGARITASVADP